MISFLSITLNSNGSWTFTWANAGAAYYRVVLYGAEQARTTELSYTWNTPGYGDFPPPLEIAYEEQLVESELFPPLLTLQWYGDQSCQGYQVEYYNGTTWEVVKVIQETGQWLYSYTTPVLTDETLYQFRVTSTNLIGTSSTPVPYNRLVVCVPKSPDADLDIAYLGSDVVVTAS